MICSRLFSCPPMSREELDFVHMHNVVDSVQHIFRHYPGIEQGAVERYRAGIDYGRFLKYLKMEDGLVEFLEMARQRCRLAISTNRTNTMRPLLATIQADRLLRYGGYCRRCKKSQTGPGCTARHPLSV